MFPSKQQVACFYCDWNGRHGKAKDHYTKQHPSRTFQLKFAISNTEQFSQKKIQKTETITDVINDGDQQQEQQFSIILSPSSSSLIHSNPYPCLPLFFCRAQRPISFMTNYYRCRSN